MGKRLGILVLLLALLAGGVVAAEVGARTYLTGQIAAGVKQAYALEGDPTVAIKGRVLLLDLVQRRLSGVTISAPTMPTEVGGRRVVLRDPRIDTGPIAIDTTTALVSRLTGSATLVTADLADIAGVPVEVTSGGRLKATYSAALFGQTMRAEVSGVPALSVEQQTVRISDAEIEIAGIPVPEELTKLFIDQVVKPIPLNLLNGWRLDAITVVPEGLQLGFSATDQSLTWRR